MPYRATLGTLGVTHVMLGTFALDVTAVLTVGMAATLEAFAFGVLRLLLGRTLGVVLMLVLLSHAPEGTMLSLTALLVCHRIAPLPSVS
jgi:hypothetical protein